MTYDADLRSLTQGVGYFTMEPSHYDPVPPYAAQKDHREAARRGEGEGSRGGEVGRGPVAGTLERGFTGSRTRVRRLSGGVRAGSESHTAWRRPRTTRSRSAADPRSRSTVVVTSVRGPTWRAWMQRPSRSSSMRSGPGPSRPWQVNRRTGRWPGRRPGCAGAASREAVRRRRPRRRPRAGAPIRDSSGGDRKSLPVSRRPRARARGGRWTGHAPGPGSPGPGPPQRRPARGSAPDRWAPRGEFARRRTPRREAPQGRPARASRVHSPRTSPRHSRWRSARSPGRMRADEVRPAPPLAPTSRLLGIRSAVPLALPRRLRLHGRARAGHGDVRQPPRTGAGVPLHRAGRHHGGAGPAPARRFRHGEVGPRALTGPRRSGSCPGSSSRWRWWRGWPSSARSY